MGIKIVIPINSSDLIENNYTNGNSTYNIEEYIWSLIIVMEQYLTDHCRSLSNEVRRMRLKWYSALQIGSLLRFGAKTRYIFLLGRTPIIELRKEDSYRQFHRNLSRVVIKTKETYVANLAPLPPRKNVSHRIANNRIQMPIFKREMFQLWPLTVKIRKTKSENHDDLLHTKLEKGTIDIELKEQANETLKHYYNILERVATAIKCLSEKSLPSRGHDEKWGSPHNANFMGLMELISEFDPFLKEHLIKC
ncbi:uncharacterized protein NPIL_512281 [Nephila pilipes]|uniref:Uncharacterized protein n=1 Tax=Nephila pilipes TaxID=299642 RepID=A0A8X6UQK2_NEPPI|nr:uncharacterized protein NPIL_512281 [Nephila pilipes]